MIQLKNYTELSELKTIVERYKYLKLSNKVGLQTFGWDRYLNQKFYTSTEWKKIRDVVIIRDMGCDLGIPGYEINSKILIHHMNPINPKDIIRHDFSIINPEYLISTSHRTHQAIHYGDVSLLPQLPIERKPGDTKLW